MRKFLFAVLVVVVMAGCASTPEPSERWLAVEQARQSRIDTLAAQCETDLCLVMLGQEASKTTPMPRQSYHPVWNILNTAISMGIPAYAGIAQTDAWGDIVQGVSGTIAGIDGSDNSVTVGGNLGNTDNSDNSVEVAGNLGDTDNSTDTSVGGNMGDTRRDTRTGDDRIGDEIGRDQFRGDWRSGDDVSEGCIGESCRSTSDGPIDQSDNSDNSDPGDDNNDNSAPVPPGGGGQ